MKNKKPLIIATVLTIITASVLLVGTGRAKAISLDPVTKILDAQLNKIIDTQLDKLIPDNFKQIVSQTRSGSAIGIDSIVSIFKSSDANGNINEESWKELDQAALNLSLDKSVRAAGLGTSYTTGQLSQTALKNINDLNNRKGRELEKIIGEERADIQEVIKKNAKPAESSLEAENQRNEIAAVAVSTDLRKLDLEARSLTAQQIANANSLKQRQEQLSERRSEQIAAKSAAEEQLRLLKVITQPYYGDK
jgi:hypothetical protein